MFADTIGRTSREVVPPTRAALLHNNSISSNKRGSSIKNSRFTSRPILASLTRKKKRKLMRVTVFMLSFFFSLFSLVVLVSVFLSLSLS